MGTKKIRKVEKAQQKQVVKDVPAENYFYMCNGKVLRNLKELRDELNSMDEGSFRYHVNEQKNDFANWINDIMKDEELANEMKSCKDITQAKQKLDRRLQVLMR